MTDIPTLTNGGLLVLLLILATCWWLLATERTDR